MLKRGRKEGIQRERMTYVKVQITKEQKKGGIEIKGQKRNNII